MNITPSSPSTPPIFWAQHKTCPHCNEVKPLNGFSRDHRRADGHASWCRTCTNRKSSLSRGIAPEDYTPGKSGRKRGASGNKLPRLAGISAMTSLMVEEARRRGISYALAFDPDDGWTATAHDGFGFKWATAKYPTPEEATHALLCGVLSPPTQ